MAENQTAQQLLVKVSPLSDSESHDIRPQTGKQKIHSQRIYFFFILKTPNSMAGVRERTIPTERPLLVGEVIANFCG
jgi:hypothetical protein